MCCAAIWSAVMPPYGSWLMRGLTLLSQVPGVIACVGPAACLFSSPLTIVICFWNGFERLEQRRELEALALGRRASTCP